MSDTKPTSARVLSTRLASTLHGFLAGRLTPQQVADELRRIATWVDKGLQRKKGKDEDAFKLQIEWLFTYWVRATGRDQGRVKLTPARKTKLKARLHEGYTLDDIVKAIDAIASSAFHQGENESGHKYDDLTLICRSGDNIEKYRDMAPRSIQEKPDDSELTELRKEARDALSSGDTDAYTQANRRIAELSGR